jgi:hypothetical protein
MRYIVLDPVDGYPGRMVEFLGRAGYRAVVLLTSPMTAKMWEAAWQHRLGEFVDRAYIIEEGDDPRAIAATIKRDFPGGFDGIMPWDELTILQGATIGELLGIGWNSRAVIERCRDKYAMKRWLAAAGKVRVNGFRTVNDAAGATAFAEQVGRWPIVVKPTGGAGSRNVFFAYNRDELLRGCQDVLESGDGEVLLEEYVGGQEYAVNGIVDRAGDLLVTDVWLYDKRDSHGFPNLYYQSIKIHTDNPAFRQLGSYVADVVESLGLRRAPVHAEVKLDDRGPCLIELGARFAGGNQPLLASQIHGRSLFELAACHYLAELPVTVDEVDYRRYDQFESRIVSGIQSVEIPRIREVHGAEAVESLPSFHAFGALKRPGARAPVTRDLATRSWEVYLLHHDAAIIARDAELVRRLLRYE